MNKKFFAALASATMAFTASGSIAVFADDFVEESNIVDNGDLKPVETEVVWNHDNFGALVKLDGDKLQVDGTALTAADGKTPLAKNVKVKTADLAKVKTINFAGSDLVGEIKGLEYFTGLETFNDNGVTKLKNKSLDFSANTSLTEIKVTKAADLSEIALPKAFVDKDKKEEYKLATLTLDTTKLTALDLSKQETLANLTVNKSELNSLDLSALDLESVTVTGNSSLKEVVLNNGRKGQPESLKTLDLQNNALETVNLDYISIKENGKLILSNNHIGALDLSKTTVGSGATATLGTQKFYVSEKLENVNLAETFENFDKKAIDKTDKYDPETGVLTIKGKTETYTYNTGLNNAKDASDDMEVKLEAANPMNRLYNPNSGEHFYTADIKEKEALVALGWNDEGYGWVADATPATDQAKKAQAVYRLYNANAGDHHYTMDENEVKTLVAYGWKDEGTGWYSATSDTVPVYRQYNPFANGAGSHNYTTDKAENDYLVSLGWTPEGTAWLAKR